VDPRRCNLGTNQCTQDRTSNWRKAKLGEGRAHPSIQTAWSNLQQYVSGVCMLLTEIF
jgi:hypothetical protein